MKFNAENKDLKNSLLYDYVRLAYSHVQLFSDGETRGDPKNFLSQLYLQRTLSIFEEYISIPANQEMDFDQFRDWFMGEKKQLGDNLFVGKIHELSVGRNADEIMQQDYEYYWKTISDIEVDKFATYLPIHYFYNNNPLSTDWGVYISELGVTRLASLIKYYCVNKSEFGPVPLEKEHIFAQIAYQILLRHELTHYRIESYALNAELILGKPLYVPYLNNIYTQVYPTDDCFEEALANSSVLESDVIEGLFKALYPETYKSWRSFLREILFRYQPPGYRNIDFRCTDTLEGSYQKFNRGEIKADRSITPRALAMNYLCNQIITGEYGPFGDNEVPFFASLPDNHFLRAENLVPIHIVPFLNDRMAFIEIAPPKKKITRMMLEWVGYEPSGNGKGDHQMWMKDGWEPITINFIKDELDLNSRTNMKRAFGLSEKEFRLFQTTKKPPKSLAARL